MRFIYTALASIVFFISFALLSPAFAHEKSENAHTENVIQLADYLDFEAVSNPQISPNGEEVIYSRRRIDKMNDKSVSTLWIMNADGSRNRQFIDGSRALWSPDGSRIAFVKSDKNDTPQIFVRFRDVEGVATQVTSFEHAPRSMAWSPDGEHIAFVVRVPLKNEWSIKLPGKPKGAKWKNDPAIIDTLHYRQDRVGLTNTGFDHIFVVPAEGGTPRQITDGKWNVGQRGIGVIAGSPILSWSPDGKTIAFDGPGKPIEAPHWFESHINIVNVASKEMTSLTDGHGVYGGPVFSPNGREVAFSGYPEHNASYPVSKLYVTSVNSGNTRTLADRLPDSPQSVTWAPDGKHVIFTMNKEGQRNLHAVDLNGNGRPVTDGKQVISFGSMSDTGAMAVITSTSDRPPAVAILKGLGDRRQIKPLTDVNSDIFADKSLGKVEEIWYESESETGESAKVQGWIVYPPDYEDGKSYPLMLSIHGGPHAMYNSGFNFTFQEFAARGYVVLYTNPRGSTGYGSDFVNAIQHRYPGPVDYADLMNGVDYVIDKGIADENRMFVTGCSGGGVLTTWVIGQTDRFKAAAALCPVVNWIGMSGTTDVVGWLYNFFPKPFWEDPKPWLDHSTIMHVGNVETPTLLMTGTKDLRTPLGEAEEYFAALKIRGVPTKLVPMEGEYHGTRSIPSNYLRTSLMLRKWFEEYDPAKQNEDEQKDE